MNSFNIILVSNANDDRNTGSHFFNRLSSNLNLDQDQWEVGVKKLIYYNSFYNIIDEYLAVSTAKKAVFKIGRKELDNVFYVNEEENLNIIFYDRVQEDKSIATAVIMNSETTPIGFSNYSNIRFKIDFKPYPIILTEEEKKDPETPPPDSSEWREASYAYGQEYSRSDPSFRAFLDGMRKHEIESVIIHMSYVEREIYPLKQGFYVDISTLLAKAIPSISGLGFSSNPKSNMVTISIDTTQLVQVELGNSLQYSLGFTETKLVNKKNTARYVPQLTRGRFAFFLYSNIVQHMKVGDREVQLLDVVTIPKAEYAIPVSVDVVNPIYRPVVLHNISEIEVGLYSDSGEQVVFDNQTGEAKTLILLHFRKRV